MSFSSSSPPRMKCQRISLKEIEDATEKFDERYALGEGREAKVYLAQIMLGQSEITQVALKHLKPNSSGFEPDIQLMSKIQHPNIVSLLGYCDDSGQKILIYEYMANGSLADYVQKVPNPIASSTTTISLSWEQRLKICLGAALGLKHLHSETKEFAKGLIHRDIKPGNILLDANWVAKISDFGMFKPSRTDQIDSVMPAMLKSTDGNYVPEYLKYPHKVTKKIDVYAFGVVLFQVLCRKMPWWDEGEESYYSREDEDLGEWARQNVDPKIRGEISDYCLNAFTEIIRKSLSVNPKKRPTMDEVTWTLQALTQEKTLKPQVARKAALNQENALKLQAEREAALNENALKLQAEREAALTLRVLTLENALKLQAEREATLTKQVLTLENALKLEAEADGPTPIELIFPERLFEEMLPHHHKFYTYESFLAATKAFRGFGSTGDLAMRLREIAAFFALTSAASGGEHWLYTRKNDAIGYLQVITYNTSVDKSVPNAQWPCVPGQKYYGRGPFLLSGNHNYGPAGEAIGVDLLKYPDLVEMDPVISFKTAIWLWMTPQPPKPSCHAVMTGGWTPSHADRVAGRRVGFGVLTTILYDGDKSRNIGYDKVDIGLYFYEKYCDVLKVSRGENNARDQQRPFE